MLLGTSLLQSLSNIQQVFATTLQEPIIINFTVMDTQVNPLIAKDDYLRVKMTSI